MTHDELVDISLKYIKKKERCPVAFKELKTIHNEWADVIGFGAYGHSVLIEVKISRADFLKDKKKPFRIKPETGIGKYRYYATPKGLISVDELPYNWGLLELDENNKLHRVYHPYTTKTGNIYSNGFENFNKEAERNILYSALRRIK